MCEHVALPDGGFAILCGGHRRSKKPCAYPGCRRFVTVECDGRTEAGRACNRATCRAHAKSIGPDRDLCWQCAIAATRQPKLQGFA